MKFQIHNADIGLRILSILRSSLQRRTGNKLSAFQIHNAEHFEFGMQIAEFGMIEQRFLSR